MSLLSLWPLTAHPQLVLRTHVLVVLLTLLHQRRPLLWVLLQQAPQKVNEIWFVAGNHLSVDEVFDDGEVDFGEAGVVAEGKGIMQGQALEDDHAESEGVGFVEVEFGGSLSIL